LQWWKFCRWTYHYTILGVERASEGGVVYLTRVRVELLEQLPATLRFQVMLAFDDEKLVLPGGFLQLCYRLVRELVQVETSDDGSKLRGKM